MIIPGLPNIIDTPWVIWNSWGDTTEIINDSFSDDYVPQSGINISNSTIFWGAVFIGAYMFLRKK